MGNSKFEITVDIESGAIQGRFPRRAGKHVLDWQELHQNELREDWDLARERRPLRRISALE